MRPVRFTRRGSEEKQERLIYIYPTGSWYKSPFTSYAQLSSFDDLPERQLKVNPQIGEPFGLSRL